MQGAVMAGDDGSDSDSDYEEQAGLLQRRRGSPSDSGFMSISQQQRKMFSLVCIIMVMATAFNVATVGFQANRKVEEPANYNGFSDMAVTPSGSMLRASSSGEEIVIGQFGGDEVSKGIREEEESSFMIKEDTNTHSQYASENELQNDHQDHQTVVSDASLNTNFGTDESLHASSGGYEHSHAGGYDQADNGRPEDSHTIGNLDHTGAYQKFAATPYNRESNDYDVMQGHNNGIMSDGHKEHHDEHQTEQHNELSRSHEPENQFGQVLLSQTELMKQMQDQLKEQQEQMKLQQEMYLKLQQQQMEHQQQVQVHVNDQSQTQEHAPPQTPAQTYEAPTEQSTPAETSTSDSTSTAAPPEVPPPVPDTPPAPEVPPEAPPAVAAPTATIDEPDVDGFKDAWDLPVNKETDTPVFWHIPKAGGSTVKDIIGTCHRFTMASEAGVAEGHDQDTEVAIVRIGGNAAQGQEPSPFVNVDTTTVSGLQRAKALGLAKSRLADVIVTPYIFDANGLFDSTYKGRLFTVFRHPVDRAISLFNYLQYADWEPTYSPELANMSLEEYARSPMVENNWMTRYLSNQIAGDLTDRNVQIAMDVVRRKFLVGLLTKKEETMERLEKYFGWKYTVNPENQETCRQSLLGTGANTNTNTEAKKEKPKPGDPAYDALAHQNNYDIMLYTYIETLFEEQRQFVQAIPDGFRLEGATCCKCGVPTC